MPELPSPDHTPVSPRPATDADRQSTPGADAETCDVCGSTDLAEIRCKVICRNCHTILRTCSDL